MRDIAVYEGLNSNELSQSNYPNDKILTVKIEGKSQKGLNYEFGFFKETQPKPSIVHINSMKRLEFQKIMSEEEAETELVGISKNLRSKIGGHFNIHPFYGAVRNTQNSLLAPGFYTSEDDRLTTIINLTETEQFSKDLTNQHVEMHPNGMALITRTYIDWSEKYHEAVNKLRNPNQFERDIAAVNHDEELWDKIYGEWNGHKPSFNRISASLNKTHAMKITQSNMIDVLHFLESDLKLIAQKGIEIRYKGLSEEEYQSSTLPKEKLRII